MKATWATSMVVVVAIGGGSAGLAQQYALVVVPPMAEGASRVVTARADVSDIARATGADGLLASAGEVPACRAAVERPDADPLPIPCQGNVDPDGQFVVSLWLDPSAAERRVRVYPEGAMVHQPQCPAALQFDQSADRVDVVGAGFRVSHAREKAWLPARIEFAGSGKVFDSFALNDRIYHPERGGYALRDDAAAKLEVLAAGPLRVALRVSARYVRDGEPAPGGAQATYTFEYLAGSPELRVEARVTQDAELQWTEIHLLEINFPDESFMRCALGDPEEERELTASSEAIRGSRWGALLDGMNVLALVGGPCTVYDGRGGYGTYLHGPWTDFRSREWRGSATVWIGSGPTALAEARQAARSPAVPRPIRLSTPRLEGAVAGMERTAREAQDVSEAGRAAWHAALVRQLVPRIGLGSATEVAEALSSAPPSAGRDARVFGTPSGELMLIDNGQAGLGLLRRPDGIAFLSLFDLVRKREVASPSGCDLFRVRTGPVGGAMVDMGPASGWGTTSAERGRVAGADIPSWVFRFADAPGAPGLSAELSARWEGPRIALRLRVANGSAERTVERVLFPTVGVCGLGDPGDDVAVFPRGPGEMRKAPLVNGGEYWGSYPDGWACMQFLAYYDSDGGLYVGIHDPLASTKGIHFLGDTGNGLVTLEFDWLAENSGRGGNGFEADADAVLELFGGDWFDAARIYRAWVSQAAPWWPSDGAKRLNGSGIAPMLDVWALGGGAPAECVEAVKRFADYMGTPCGFHWYNWHQIPFDVQYPHYFPTKPGFAEGVAELQASGVRVMPYINGRLWDTGCDDFDAKARPFATKKPDGTPNIEEYGSGAKLSPMCPTTELWRQTVAEIVGRLVGPECHVDGVYIDQVAAAAPAPCYDSTHGHPVGGGHYWTVDGYWPLMERVRRALPEGKFLTTECNAEPYAHLFDSYLTWHWQQQDAIPLFPAVYGGQIGMFGRSYGAGPDRALATRMKAAQQLVFGEQIGWIGPDVIDRPDEGPFVRQAVRIRRALHDYIVDGEMAHPPVVVGDVPTVTADWQWSGKWIVTTDALLTGSWRARDGRLVAIFANVSDAPISVTWRFDGAAQGLRGPRLVVARRTETDVSESLTDLRFDRPLTVEPRQVVAFELRDQ